MDGYYDDGYAETFNEKVVQLIDEANGKLPLHLVLQSYNIPLIKSFSEWSASVTCPFPFHKNGHERSPSFGYNFKRDFFHCFGCSTSGRAVEFISAIESKSKIDVAKNILQKFNVNIGDFNAKDEKELRKLLFEFAKFVRENKNDARLAKLVYWIDSYVCKSQEVSTKSLKARLERLYELYNSR